MAHGAVVIFFHYPASEPVNTV